MISENSGFLHSIDFYLMPGSVVPFYIRRVRRYLSALLASAVFAQICRQIAP